MPQSESSPTDGQQRTASGDKPSRWPQTSGSGKTVRDKIARQLTGELATIGLTISAFRPTTGRALVLMSEEVAGAWADWAAVNPKVRRILEGGISVSAGAKAILATTHLVAVILADLNVIPRQWLPLLMGGTVEQAEAKLPETKAPGSVVAPPSEQLREEAGA